MSGIVLLVAGFAGLFVAARIAQASLGGEHRIALVATLGALAAAYNVIVPVPNVEATTLVVVTGALVLGAPTATAVGVLAIIGTSSVSSVGVWTMWQVVAVACIAVATGAIGRVARSRGSTVVPWERGPFRALALAVTLLATMFYDVFTTWTSVASFGGAAQQSLDVALLAGIPFYVVHTAANLALAALVSPALLAALERVRPKLDGGRIVA